MERTVEQLRNEAAELEQQKEESFQRCDTDGFLSQWAGGITAELKRTQAEVIENGGVWEFPALFDLEGNRVRAKLTQVKVGNCNWLRRTVWAFCDENGRFTGKFIGAFPKRESTMERKGYREGKETSPAVAKILGRGYGLSGTAWVAVVRKDSGYPEEAK